MHHLLVGNIDFPVQLAQGWTFHQAEFRNSYLVGITNGELSLMLLTPPYILLHPSPYAELPKQPCDPIFHSVNPVNSAVTMSQPSQPKEPEAWVYESKSEVCPYGLFTAGQMIAKVRLSFVYNSLPWVIRQLTINDLATLWDVPLLLQEKL